MTTSELLKSKPKTLVCTTRKIAVDATPEENVRQKILSYMISHLGYPHAYIMVEKELMLMPHLSGQKHKFPNRRADIVCFAPDLHPDHSLYPLLLIECKAVKLTQKVVNQVIGYNYYVKSPFIAIANTETIQTGWKDHQTGEFTFVSYLPSYQELMKWTYGQNGQ